MSKSPDTPSPAARVFRTAGKTEADPDQVILGPSEVGKSASDADSFDRLFFGRTSSYRGFSKEEVERAALAWDGHPSGPWFEMTERLQRLLGDVRLRLGGQWHAVLDRLFTRHDLEVARSLLDRTGTAPSWFVLSFPGVHSWEDDLGDGECRRCAPSEAHAIAYLRHACAEQRLLPDVVAHDPATRHTSLYFQGERIAEVRPAPFVGVSSQLSKRAKTALLGLRDTSRSVEAELAKRFQGWPRMPALVLDSRDGGAHSQAHLPDPKEWLDSARMLCTLCGIADASTRLVQEVAATALDAPSWNHLSAGAGERLTALTPPWMVADDNGLDGPRIFRTPYEALADGLMRLPQATADWSGVQFSYWRAVTACHETPALRFSELRDRTVHGADGHRDKDGGAIFIHEMAGVDGLEGVELRVDGSRDALDGGEVALARYFHVGSTPSQRSIALDADNAEVEIARDGPWRFTSSGKSGDTKAMLTAHRSRSDGSSEFVAGVRTYKGQLRLHAETGFHVLCGDYDGRTPVAVLDGISTKVVRELLNHLPACDGRLDRYDPSMLHSGVFGHVNAAEFDALCAKARLWQATRR